MALKGSDKAAFNTEIKPLKKELDDLKKHINELTVKRKKHKKLEGYYSIEASMLLLRSVGMNCRISNISHKMLDVRNSKFLDNAKSDFSKVLQLVGETVGTDIDRSLKANDEYLDTIAQINPEQILRFVKDLHTSFRNLKESYGQDTKWKWQFVDFYAKMAVLTKNLTRFSDIAKLRDPRTEYFHERKELMALCKEYLAEAARQYRTKYELSGNAREDLQKTIDYLSALRKIHVMFGEDAEADKLKTTIDANQQTLEAGDSSGKKKKK